MPMWTWGPNKGRCGAKPRSPQRAEPRLCPWGRGGSTRFSFFQVTLLPSPKSGTCTRSHLPPTLFTDKSHHFSTWSLWQQTQGQRLASTNPTMPFQTQWPQGNWRLVADKQSFSSYLTTHFLQFFHPPKMGPWFSRMRESYSVRSP